MKATILPVLAVLSGLAACEPAPAPAEEAATVTLPLFRGYRDPADQCRLTGESDYTNQFLDDAADLVTCPTDYEGVGVFVTETGAIEVDRVGAYTLFTVPVR